MLNKMSQQGILCIINNEQKPNMQRFTQFNGYFGCNWCLHKGEFYTGSMRYLIPDDMKDLPKLRNSKDSKKNMKEAVKTGSAVNGFITSSLLTNLNYFDLTYGFCPDYTHYVLL